MSESPLKIVFLSVENACCSQMAEAFARILTDGRVEASSAGSQPAAAISPAALTSMQAIGYDLSQHQPKPISALPAEEFDAAITVRDVATPAGVRARLQESWHLPDPGQLGALDFNLVRDLISHRVGELLSRLKNPQEKSPGATE